MKLKIVDKIGRIRKREEIFEFGRNLKNQKIKVLLRNGQTKEMSFTRIAALLEF